jgi:hypothetical protein
VKFQLTTEVCRKKFVWPNFVLNAS